MKRLLPFRHAIGFALLCLVVSRVSAALDYELLPRLIAPDTYAVFGSAEDFDFDNGGNIANSAFIITKVGVVVIDTGSSRLYGEQLRAAIGRLTPLPVIRVINTHHHPDHFFGNQAFADVPIAALARTRQSMQDEGAAFANNLYRMSGLWMQATEPLAATESLAAGVWNVGGHSLRMIALGGHTAADLVVLDETTATLFAGDLVFSQRTLTTPHANLSAWLDSLATLRGLEFERMLPGHGPLQLDADAIDATAAQLRWLQRSLTRALDMGLSMSETMQLEIPQPYAAIPLARHEFVRSVVHLYPALEAKALPRIDLPDR